MTQKPALSIDYDAAAQVLNEGFSQAEADVANGAEPNVTASYRAAVKTLFESNTQSFREVALGCAIARLLAPGVDITLPYANQGPTAFNGRTLDEKVVNPFLHDRQVPASKGPYLATFRRSVKFDATTREGVRDKLGYDAFLLVLANLRDAGSDDEVKRLLSEILIGFVRLRDASLVPLAKINRLNLDQYDALFEELLKTRSGGLIPVLLTVAMFQTIKECYNLDGWKVEWQGINVADKASGAGGDISIFQGENLLFAIEVTERPIDKSRVVSTFNTKISPAGIEDYIFVFTGTSPAQDAREAATQFFGQGHDVNFVDIKPWLLNNLATMGAPCRAKFTRNFLGLMDTRDVPAVLKVKWNDLVKRLFG
ncbi:restriction endonuclease, SacI family (plasmid) [Agrobacterium tumefaciens]|nr:restriction endonuclease, SacI family [Agrobacterium tumefaciens]CUX64889.1 conserved hypothetical protein [Agrobacterium genomosp. 5 str. CFBP 6626]